MGRDKKTFFVVLPARKAHVSCDSYMKCGRALTNSPSTEALSFLLLVTVPPVKNSLASEERLRRTQTKRHPQRICQVLGVLLHLFSWSRHESKKRPWSVRATRSPCVSATTCQRQAAMKHGYLVLVFPLPPGFVIRVNEIDHRTKQRSSDCTTRRDGFGGSIGEDVGLRYTRTNRTVSALGFDALYRVIEQYSVVSISANSGVDDGAGRQEERSSKSLEASSLYRNKPTLPRHRLDSRTPSPLPKTSNAHHHSENISTERTSSPNCKARYGVLKCRLLNL